MWGGIGARYERWACSVAAVGGGGGGVCGVVCCYPPGLCH